MGTWDYIAWLIGDLVSKTCQCFNKWLILPFGALDLLANPFPVTLAYEVLQSVIDIPVPHVFHRRSTMGFPLRILPLNANIPAAS